MKCNLRWIPSLCSLCNLVFVAFALLSPSSFFLSIAKNYFTEMEKNSKKNSIYIKKLQLVFHNGETFFKQMFYFLFCVQRFYVGWVTMLHITEKCIKISLDFQMNFTNKQCSKLHVSNSSSFICRASHQWVFILFSSSLFFSVIIWFRRLLFYSYSFHMFILYISLEFKCLYAIRYTSLIKWLLRLMIRCWFCWLSARHWIAFQYLILV